MDEDSGVVHNGMTPSGNAGNRAIDLVTGRYDLAAEQPLSGYRGVRSRTNLILQSGRRTRYPMPLACAVGGRLQRPLTVCAQVEAGETPIDPMPRGAGQFFAVASNTTSPIGPLAEHCRRWPRIWRASTIRLLAASRVPARRWRETHHELAPPSSFERSTASSPR